MSTKQIDIFNIALIIISLIIAIKLPFELFLFSYAILGPLHYLTEISWLRDKNYFIEDRKKWVIVFIVFSLIIAIYPVLQFANFSENDPIGYLLQLMASQAGVVLVSGFLFSICLVFLKKTTHLITAFVLSVLGAYLLNTYLSQSAAFLIVFLPTVIHVYLFTLLFVLYGARKAKSKYGILLGVLLLLVPFIIMILPLENMHVVPSEKVTDIMVGGSFASLNAKIADMVGGFEDGIFLIFSGIGVKIQIFIAFAYTYHYLNWFSKTTVIGWSKNITKKKGILILVIWIISIVMYAYDFNIGFIALLFLSYTHLFLEFPLNILTIKEVFRFPVKK